MNIITAIAIKPISPAIIAHTRALFPKLGLIFSSCIKISGAGIAQSFSAVASSLADSLVNEPSI
jgi:hypothetical protein